MRDFYYNICFYKPHVIGNSLKEKYDKIKWENDSKLFKKWKEGRTGYLGDNLEDNIRKCLKLNRKSIASNINQQWSWTKCIDILHSHLLNEVRK